MVSQRKPRLFLGLGLAMAFALAVSPASASAVSTLTGESLNGGSSQGNTFLCPSPTYSVGGNATGPYAGTFSEAGTWTVSTDSFSATFTIASGTTTITGSKSGVSDGGSACGGGVPAFAIGTAVPYTATIHTPTGNFRDEGTSSVTAQVFFESGAATLTESFTSSLTQPVRVAPTNKDECKNGGWQPFFRNQGQCVSSFQSQSQT
jgi:hypothetical protein